MLADKYGWDTVASYTAEPLALDSEDEKHIRNAIKLLELKLKSRSIPQKGFLPVLPKDQRQLGALLEVESLSCLPRASRGKLVFIAGSQGTMHEIVGQQTHRTLSRVASEVTQEKMSRTSELRPFPGTIHF